jgi:hypothetical protein
MKGGEHAWHEGQSLPLEETGKDALELLERLNQRASKDR